jgi:Flp pilus assembly protein CpaB
MSDHNWVLENLESYHAGGLDAAERERLESHLAKCAPCSKALQEIRGLDDRLEGLFSSIRPEPGLEDRMIRSLRTAGENFRLPVIGWIGLSAAAAVLLAVVGALMQNAVLDDHSISLLDMLPGGAKVKILYAKEKVSAYTPIKSARDMFEEKEVPQKQAPPDAVASSDIDKLDAFTVVKDIGPNEPLTSSSLKDKGTMGLEAKISPGLRAVAINTDAAKVAGGFVLPDSHVDVYQTSPQNGESKLVAQDVKVRAVDLLPVRPEDKPGAVPTTVTLEASPKQTQSLIAAQDSGGKLTLALRPFVGDTSSRMGGAVFADGSVHDVKFGIDPEVFKALGNMNDLDQMASRLREEAVAKVNSGKSVAFSPDGKGVLSGGKNAVKLWDKDTGGENGSLGVEAGDYLKHDPKPPASIVAGAAPQPNNGKSGGMAQMMGGMKAMPGGGSFGGGSGGTIVGGGQQQYPMSGGLLTPKSATPPAVGYYPPSAGSVTLRPQGVPALNETGKDGIKLSQEAMQEVHTYRNDAVAAPTYFRPAELATAEAQKLAKELDEKIRVQTINKKPDSRSGVVVGLSDASFTSQLEISGKEGKKEAKPPAEAAGPRKIVIRSGDIEFEVDSFDSAVATVTLLVNKIQNGFVATVNSEKLPNGKVRGSVVVRVPPEGLDGLVLDLRKELGKSGELKGQKIGSQDITKQYTDLESRLKAARAMEERLLQIIKSGKGEIKDLLAAEKELGIWRTKIEEFEGELRYYANQVALSTLTITLAEKEIRAPFAVIETERVQMAVEAEDVIKAQQQVLKAVDEAKGRVTKSELKQFAADQLRAVIHFEVAPDKAGPLRDRIDQIGRRTRLDIDRLQETEGGTGRPGEAKTRRKDTQFQLSLFNVANIAPRETVHLKLACVDAEDVYKKILSRVETAKGRVVTSNLSRQRNDQTLGVIQFEVKSADAGAVLVNLKDLGEVMRLQMTENPDTENVTRSKQGINVELLALGTVQARETTCIQLATRDVPAGYGAIKEALTKAKGQISVAQLNEQNKQNITAQFDFEIRRADEAAVSAAMTAAGDIFSRNVTRAADADNVVDSKVRWQVSLINQDQIAPRETTTLGIEVNNVDKTAAEFMQLATASKGRTVGSDVARERTGRTTAKLIFTVPLSAAPALMDKFRDAGTVRVQRHSENPQVPESELAVARLDVTLSNAPLIVPSDEGFGPELRKGLSTSVKVLSLSLSFLLFGLLVVLPWAVVIYVIYRLVMRMRRKTGTVPMV